MVAKSEPLVALRTIMYYLLLRHITKKKQNENKVIEKGKKSKKHEPLGRSSKKLVPSIEEYVEESRKQNNQSPVPSSEQSHQIEQKRVEAVDIKWIYPLLPFYAISCILYNEMVAPKHF